MAVPPGRVFLAVLTPSLILSCVWGGALKWARRTERHVHGEATTFSLEESVSRILRNYLTTAQSIPHTTGLHVTHVRVNTAYGTIQGVSDRNFIIKWDRQKF